MNIAPAPQTRSPAQSIESLKLDLVRDLAPKHWQKSLVRFGDHLAAGKDWETAIHQAAPKSGLASLLRAAVLCPDPFQTLAELLQSRRQYRSVYGSLLPLCYPIAIVVVTFVLTSILAWTAYYLVGEEIFMDWWTGQSLDQIPKLFLTQWHRSVLVGSIAAWFALVAMILAVLAPKRIQVQVLKNLPWLGKVYTWSMMRDLICPLSVFLRSGINCQTACDALVLYHRGTLLEVPARGLANRLNAGQSIGLSVANSMLCDEILRPVASTFLDAKKDSPLQLQRFAEFCNRLFEQRAHSIVQVGTRIGILVTLCMYARIALDIVLTVQSSMTWFGPGALKDSFVGNSSTWLVLLPIAAMNLIFVAAMFRTNSKGNQSISVNAIRLFGAISIAFAFVAATLRCTASDTVYLFPLLMMAFALRRDQLQTKRFAAAQALVSCEGNVEQSNQIADMLIDDNTGGIRRRVRAFKRALASGASQGSAITRSKLVADSHYRWLLAMRDQFGPMPESESILQLHSPWTDLSEKLLQRILALKWLSIIAAVGIAVQIFFVWPTMLKMTQEFGVKSPTLSFLQTGSWDGWFESRIVNFIFYELFDPYYSFWGSMTWLLILIAILAFQFIPFFKTWFVSLFMRPAYRAWTLRGIGEALASDQRLEFVLSQSSQTHPVRKIRNQLTAVVHNIDRGVSVQDAFAQSKLIRPSQRAFLKLATEPKQLAWSIGQIANRNYFRWMERYLLLADLLMVLVVLLSATVIAILAYAEFSFLASLITSLS
jgi:type II secretory pathway component PulF